MINSANLKEYLYPKKVLLKVLTLHYCIEEHIPTNIYFKTECWVGNSLEKNFEQIAAE